MRHYLALIIALSLVTCSVRAAESWQPLFNGKNLDGWTTWLAKPAPSVDLPGAAKDDKGAYTQPIGANRDPLGVFTVVTEDGQPALRVSGQVFGEIRSKQSFENYRLRLQFKWGQKKWPPREKDATPRDSGLLYHVHGPAGENGRTWARSIELQIQEHDVGDLYAITSYISVRAKLRDPKAAKMIYDYDPAGDWRVFAQMPGSDGRCVKQPDNEKPNGEWNTVEIVCLGEESLHIVNGKVVMRLFGPRRIDTPVPTAVTSGPIILQSEGSELFYRAIEWQPIKAIPAEFAAK